MPAVTPVPRPVGGVSPWHALRLTQVIVDVIPSAQGCLEISVPPNLGANNPGPSPPSKAGSGALPMTDSCRGSGQRPERSPLDLSSNPMMDVSGALGRFPARGVQEIDRWVRLEGALAKLAVPSEHGVKELGGPTPGWARHETPLKFSIGADNGQVGSLGEVPALPEGFVLLWHARALDENSSAIPCRRSARCRTRPRNWRYPSAGLSCEGLTPQSRSASMRMASSTLPTKYSYTVVFPAPLAPVRNSRGGRVDVPPSGVEAGVHH